MRFPKVIRNRKTKVEVTIYGKSKGGEPKKDGTRTRPYPFYRICWRVAGQRRMKSFFDEYRLLFLDACVRARKPRGADALEAAIKLAQTRPEPPQAARYKDPKVRRLIAVCWHLQNLNESAPIYLSARSAATILGISNPTRALHPVNGLVIDKVLILVEKGKPSGTKASRFRFNYHA